MSDNESERQAEIERIRAAADEMAGLMNCRFVLDDSKVKAFSGSLGASLARDEQSDPRRRAQNPG